MFIYYILNMYALFEIAWCKTVSENPVNLFENITIGKTFHTDEDIMRMIIYPKIVNGEEAKLGDLPYQVAFKFPMGYSMITFGTFCGGSIIKIDVVLSAAHCFVTDTLPFLAPCIGRVDQRKAREAYAVAGQLANFASFSQDSDVTGQWRKLGPIIYPKYYRMPTDDIAVVHLRKPFFFNQNVQPILMAQKYTDYGGLQCLASGFGNIALSVPSTYLKKGYLEVLPKRTCDKMFMIDTQNLVCATDRIANVLQGDSGGPLVCPDMDNGNKTTLIGIVSAGLIGTGSLFTRVSAYKDFIAESEARYLSINLVSLLASALTPLLL